MNGADFAAGGMIAWLVLVFVLAGGGALGTTLVLGRLRRRGRSLTVLMHALDATSDVCQVIAPDGCVFYANPAAARLFEAREPHLAAPNLTEMRLADVLAGRADPTFADDVAALQDQAAAEREGHSEILVSQSSQKTARLQVTTRPLGEGYTLWTARDITSTQRLREMLRQERDRFADLLEQAPVGFFSVDAEGRFLFANQTLAGWLGTTPERLESGRFRLHDVSPEAATQGRPAHSPFDGGETHEGQTEHGEIDLVGADGQGFRAQVTQEVVPEDGGRGYTTRSVVRNISRERRFAEALAHSERRLRRLFESAPVGIGFLADSGRLTETNAAFQTLLLGRTADLRGQCLDELVRAEDREAVAAALGTRGAMESGPPQVHGLESERVCTVFASPFSDEAGEERQVVYLIDSTEQKKLEIQFVQSMKMQAVGQLAGGVAHDFNNLLTAMIGFCDLLLLRHRPGDQSFADLMQIKQNANRAAGLVRQLLAFSRQQTLRPSVLSLTDVLTELKHLLGRLIGENIALEMSHGRDLHPVKVDQGQLEQVIINLAVNARDAMAGEGGRLSIRTQNLSLDHPLNNDSETIPSGDYVLIEIADTGTGIAREHLDRIFEPFFSTKEFGAGTGLGLSTVYGIVKQTGGFILVESEIGEGTTFRIYLPRYHETTAQGATTGYEKESTRDLSGAGTILLVEDEEAVRTFSARALRKKGYEVLEASSGEDALDLLAAREAPLDVLITDVIMPQIDGPTLAARARETRPSLKVIFISGYTEDTFRRQLDGAEAVHFLAKPFNLRDLAGKVKEVLGTSES